MSGFLLSWVPRVQERGNSVSAPEEPVARWAPEQRANLQEPLERNRRTHTKTVIILSLCLSKSHHCIIFHSDLEDVGSGRGLESGVFWESFQLKLARGPRGVTLLGSIHSRFIKRVWSPSDVPGAPAFPVLRDRTHSAPADLVASTSPPLPVLPLNPTAAGSVCFLWFYFWWTGEQWLTTNHAITLPSLLLGVLGAVIFTF